MIKREISLDEKWPVFTLDKPKNEDGPWVVELNEEFYKEYCFFMYKYHEYQTRLQLIYEHRQRELSQQSCGFRVPEGFEPDKDFTLNTIRQNDVAEAQV